MNKRIVFPAIAFFMTVCLRIIAQTGVPYDKSKHHPYMFSVIDTIHSASLDETRTICPMRCRKGTNRR